MATRTAPAFTAAATRRVVSFHLIDKSGDLISVPVDVPVAATAADIEALAADYQTASQASLYEIEDRQYRAGNALAANADVGQRNSVKDGINLAFKNATTNIARALRLVAPAAATMEDDSDVVDISDASVVDVADGYTGLNTGFAFVSAQYTERKERAGNPKVRPS